MINKKADLTSKQLVTIIILIVSFAIILAFLFMLNLKETIDKESCRNSVILKGTSALGALTQFKCQTQDVCIFTEIGCSGESKNTLKIKVKVDSGQKDYSQIYKALADLQYDCFWMMGEGKIDIGRMVCSLCSIVSFDRNLAAEKISREGYFKYLESTRVPDEDYSYLYYFYKEPYWESLKKKWIDSKAIPSLEAFDFDASKKYAVYYRYHNNWVETKSDTGITSYDEDSIAKMECEEFATTFPG